jgi:adenine phosphoribosyltransferase
MEVQEGAVVPGSRIVVLDDLLATGGTMEAAIRLLRQVGADVVAAGAIIELDFLKGRERVNAPMHTLVRYEA